MREKPDRAANNEVKAVMAQTIKLDDARELDFDREMVEQAYDRWAPIYDLVFGGVFSKGRDAAIQATNKIGGRVLEVGVGTGISLPLYAPHVRIFGTDISEAMLNKAKRRVSELRLKNIEGLAVMDAEKLEFADDSFDVVMAQYVVTAVPNPEAGRRRTDHPHPRQRRCGHAPHHRADAAAAGAPAWFPHRRVRLVALHAVAFGCLEDGVGGAPPDSAARSLLPGSLPEGRRGLTRQKFRSRVVILGCVTF
jgi:SAM-dependent methyltransferase